LNAAVSNNLSSSVIEPSATIVVARRSDRKCVVRRVRALMSRLGNGAERCIAIFASRSGAFLLHGLFILKNR
jgi:hypothetical protein